MSRKLYEKEIRAGFSRRSFLKGCAMTAAALGLSDDLVPRLVEAATSPKRPPVVWLHFQECTGCTEALLRSSHPDIGSLILDIISLDYHETIMAAAGNQAEEILEETIEKHKGKFICVAEGAVPTKDNGIYCKVGGRTALETIKNVAPKAAAVISIGTCASFGGVQAASPNPTGAKGIGDVLGKRVINIPGCPPNPIAFLGTVLHLLTFKRLPELDGLGRPLFAYGRRNHDQCERRAHFDEGRFVEQFGDENHKKGYCLYKVGCKGPVTYANCPAVRFNDVSTWPVGIGHGCIGCTEPNFWDTCSPFYKHLPGIRMPGSGIVTDAETVGEKILGISVIAAGIHAAVGMGKHLLKGGQDKNK